MLILHEASDHHEKNMSNIVNFRTRVAKIHNFCSRGIATLMPLGIYYQAGLSLQKLRGLREATLLNTFFPAHRHPPVSFAQNRDQKTDPVLYVNITFLQVVEVVEEVDDIGPV